MKKAILAVVILLLIGGLGFVAVKFITPAIFSVKDGFTHSQQGELTLSGADSLEIIAAVDECAVTGSKTPNIVTVSLTINSDISPKEGEELVKKGLTWRLEQRGSRAVVSIDLKPNIKAFLKGTKTYTYMEITVPPAIDLTVRDGAGASFYKSLQNKTTINNERGDIKIVMSVGDITIEDKGKDIFLENITGKITVKDAAGAIDMTKIKGAIDITDTVGPIRLSAVEGNIAIKNARDAVYIESVKGDLALSLKNRGSLVLKKINGEIILNE